MQPDVRQNELQNQLGVLPPSEGALYALVGVSSQGPIATPATFARISDVTASFGSGPLVEAAAHYIERYARPVLLVRTTATTPGSYLDAVDPVDGSIGAITKTGTGTATYSDNASDPTVTADVVILFPVGGTQGTAGIIYQVSLDGGATFGVVHALGTANHIDVTGTGASISISSLGTVVAGDMVSFHLTGPIEASAGEVTTSGLQNTPTLDDTTHPWDDYEVRISFVTGGTRGTPGITYTWSLDDGRTLSAVTALGTATSIVVPESGGVKIDLGSGTIAAGAQIAFPTVAPKWNTTDLGVALDALKNSAATWEIVHVVGPSDSDDAAAIDLKVSGMAEAGKYHAFISSARLPVGDESEATYLSSLGGEFSGFSTVFGSVCAGAIETISSVSGRKYVRPFSFVAAAREAASSQEVNTAWVGYGAMPVSKIRDANGNVLHHDESANPGLDDARFYVARTWDGYGTNVYVNRPRLFSSDVSDFELMPHRRVMNIARAVSRVALILELNRPIVVNATSGFIDERTAREIEATVTAELVAALLGEKPKASSVTFVISRTDNLLSTKTMNATLRIVPLAYVETIEEEISYTNPALSVVKVG